MKKRKTTAVFRGPFEFEEGRIIANKYVLLELLGSGSEGEVYKAEELSTGFICCVKFFYPHVNKHNRKAIKFSKLLFTLADSPVAVNYFTQERIRFRNHDITAIVFEFVEGEMLSTFLQKHRGQRIGVLEGLILLHSLARGIETIHALNQYHGDLHSDNIILSRKGMGFQFKLVDPYNWGDSKSSNRSEDVINLIRIFYEALGGAKHYKNQPKEVKDIILGLKRSLILKKFRSARALANYIENIEWQSVYRI